MGVKSSGKSGKLLLLFVSYALIVLLVLAMTTGFALAQSDEVRRQVQRAVTSAVSSSISDAVSLSIEDGGVGAKATGTVWLTPTYNHTTVDFSGSGSSSGNAYGSTLGGVYSVTDQVLIHGAVGGIAISADSVDASFIYMLVGADFVFYNTSPLKAWFTLEGNFSNLDSDIAENLWFWAFSPSFSLSARVADKVLIEPTVGTSVGDSFSDFSGVSTLLYSGVSIKYRGEQWRPQLNFTYSKGIDPDTDAGIIGTGPEILFAVRPNLLIGASYTYSTVLSPDVDMDVNSHTVELNFRYTF